MTTGYPVGTVCVVTWQSDADAVYHRMGDVVKVTSEAFMWKPGNYAFGKRMGGSPECTGMLVQMTDAGEASAIPVAWLRPLSDPDAELEPVESLEQPA